MLIMSIILLISVISFLIFRNTIKNLNKYYKEYNCIDGLNENENENEN